MMTALSNRKKPLYAFWPGKRAEKTQREADVVIAARQGNAAAGGVMLALAADLVYARKGTLTLRPLFESSKRRSYYLHRRDRGCGSSRKDWRSSGAPAEAYHPCRKIADTPLSCGAGVARHS